VTFPVLVGTYRYRRYIHLALSSLREFVSGAGELIFIDDTGDEDHHRWLSRHGEVVAVPRPGGYSRAMRAACEAAAGRTAMWLEEDFEFVAPVDLDEMAAILDERRYLSQVALLRQPVFDYEMPSGSVIGGLEDLGHMVEFHRGIWETDGCFTCNPSLWPGWVWQEGWEAGPGSEQRKRQSLLRRGYRFSFLPEVRVHHHGEHEGHGY
jgi:hypothetical protein